MKKTRSAITPAQAAARRANGKLSHGPVTDAGKAASSKNALKFGFFARTTLIPGESAEELAAFRSSLYEAYQPVGGAEVMLVERLVETGWRLRRFPAVEASLYSAQLLEEQAKLALHQAEELMHEDVSHAAEAQSSGTRHLKAVMALLDRSLEIREERNSPEHALGRIFSRDARRGGAFDRLTRCEMFIERGFYRCMRELERLQQARAARPAAIPQMPVEQIPIPQNEPTNLPSPTPNPAETKELDVPRPAPGRTVHPSVERDSQSNDIRSSEIPRKPHAKNLDDDQRCS